MVAMDAHLLQWDEARRVGGTDTRSTVLNRLVCDGEFTQVMSNHLRLYKNINISFRNQSHYEAHTLTSTWLKVLPL